MILCFDSLRDMDFAQLMEVYEEGNRCNGKKLYSLESEAQQLLLAGQDFEDYLRRDFFAQKGAQYFVLEEGGRYVSALRVEPYKDGLILCAMETKPDCRLRGYAKRLLEGVLKQLNSPVYSHISKRNKTSICVHQACGFLKLHDGARYLDGSVNAMADTYVYRK